MDKNRVREAVCVLIGGFLIVTCLLLVIFAYTVYEETLIDRWVPVAVSLAVAVPLAPMAGRMWAKVSILNVRWFNIVSAVVLVGSLVYSSILLVNKYCGEGDWRYQERCVIEKKERSTHSRTQRVGRRTIRSAGSYYKYHFRLRMSDGREKDVSIKAQEYKKANVGDTVTVVLKSGYLGYPVVEEVLPLPEIEKKRPIRQTPYRMKIQSIKSHVDSVVGSVGEVIQKVKK